MDGAPALPEPCCCSRRRKKGMHGSADVRFFFVEEA